MDTETKTLVQRWILAFCETPVLIDPELMQRVLDSAEAAKKRANPELSKPVAAGAASGKYDLRCGETVRPVEETREKPCAC